MAPEHWTFPESTLLLLCELEGALHERLSPSLKRATKDLLGNFMAFAKVVVTTDPELERLRAEGQYEHQVIAYADTALETAIKDLFPGLKTITYYDPEETPGEDRYDLRIMNQKVPDYWRLPSDKALDSLFSLTVKRGGNRNAINCGGAFDAVGGRIRLNVDVRIHVPKQLSPHWLPPIKREALNTIFHELQHFYQTTSGVALSSREQEKYQAGIRGYGDQRHYYLSSIELDATTTALYRQAANQRQPLEKVVADYVARVSRGVRGDPDFYKDYATALAASLEKKYPRTREIFDLKNRILKLIMARRMSMV